MAQELDKVSSEAIEEVFTFYIDKVRDFKNVSQYKLSTETKLKFYGLYKQALHGDCVDPFNVLDGVEKQLKQSAWRAVKGMTKRTAMCQYITLCEDINKSIGY